jgi:DNA-binding IclR family transcriptional regulator
MMTDLRVAMLKKASAARREDASIVPVLGRAMKLLELIGAGGLQGDRTVNTEARELGIAPATAYRIVHTFIVAGWVERVGRPGGKSAAGYRLTPRVTALFGGPDLTRSLADAAATVLPVLADACGLNVKLSVRDGDEAVTVARAEAGRVLGVVSGHVGSRFTLCVGSSGAALASALSDDELRDAVQRSPRSAWARQSPTTFVRRAAECRRRGWCVDRGSYHPSVHSLSVPVRDVTGRVLGALTALALPADLSSVRLPAVRRLLTAAAERIAVAARPPCPTASGSTAAHHAGAA